MEEIIRTILQVDREARQMRDQALAGRENADAKIEERKRELYRHYEESLREIVEMTTQEQDQVFQREHAIIDAQTQKRMEALDARCEADHETWVREIVSRVLGE